MLAEIFLAHPLTCNVSLTGQPGGPWNHESSNRGANQTVERRWGCHGAIGRRHVHSQIRSKRTTACTWN